MTYGQRVNHSSLITTLLYLTDGLSYESCSAFIHLPNATDSLRMDAAHRIGADQVALGRHFIYVQPRQRSLVHYVSYSSPAGPPTLGPWPFSMRPHISVIRVLLRVRNTPLRSVPVGPVFALRL
jgi:hypothetical protein